jgi:hypothetical protein
LTGLAWAPGGGRVAADALPQRPMTRAVTISEVLMGASHQ